jgi:hypothetical protein
LTTPADVEAVFDESAAEVGAFAAAIFSSDGDCGVRSDPRAKPGGTLMVSMQICLPVEAWPGPSS